MNQILTETQRKHLRGLAHALKPVVQTGNAGLSDAVLKELEKALEHHELIKVRLVAADRDDRNQMLDRLLEETGATLVQRVGHVATLFRRNAEKPRVQLPV
ncbi:MAG: ribosome assembly RNA-binding protein YhbY [Gammaproteobacteria bacterium]|jgi:RNA-binding protein